MNAINGRVLPDLSQMDRTQLEALVSGLQAKVARAANRKVSLKVSEKGAASLYGLGRFPVTLYRSQWERLIDSIDDIKTFLVDNADRLSEKE